MITIPLRFLLLALSNLTGVAPPQDIPASQMVVVYQLSQRPADYGATTLNGSQVNGFMCWESGLAVCDGAPLGAIHLDTDLWATPRFMQHIVLHEYRHSTTMDEAEAEAYACKWFPMRVTVSGQECRP